MFFLKYLEKGKVLNHVYVVFVVIISFVIFNGVDMGQAWGDIKGMFGLGNVPLISSEAIYYLKSYGMIFVLAIIGATPVAKRMVAKTKVLHYMEPFAILALLMIVTAYLVDGSFNPFLYFRF